MELIAALGAAIGVLALLAGLGWYFYAKAMELVGGLVVENKALKEGAEVHHRADKILAEPVRSGGNLRARLLARAERHELSGSGSHGGASASTGSKSTGG